MFPQHIYSGFKYTPWEDVEEDNIKIFHDVITPENEVIHMDWSPYSIPTFEDFKLWVQLGCPNRSALHQGGAIDRNSLLVIKKHATGGV